MNSTYSAFFDSTRVFPLSLLLLLPLLSPPLLLLSQFPTHIIKAQLTPLEPCCRAALTT